MGLAQHGRKILLALTLSFTLLFTAACGGTTVTSERTNQPALSGSSGYAQIEQGNTRAGQDFGEWVAQTAKGLVKDAYVRDNDKLGVVITPQVSPDEVRPFAKSLVEGFRKNFTNKDLTVLVYAPDKELILTAQYDNRLKQIQYQ